MDVIHHGAASGVTGSCHEFLVAPGASILIDIGLFQGAETSAGVGSGGSSGSSGGSGGGAGGGAGGSGGGAGTGGAGSRDAGGSGGRGEASESSQEIDFPLDNVRALVITHCHIDHVGRLPWLLIAGFRGPIYCTRATAHLLPMVIEDALKVGLTRNAQLIQGVLKLLDGLLQPVDYDEWIDLHTAAAALPLHLRFRQAGHILGSSYVEITSTEKLGSGTATSVPAEKMGSGTATSVPAEKTGSGTAVSDPVFSGRVVFSGDLGCKNSPLLPDPTPLEHADMLVLESTYGDRNHENRAERQQRLQRVIEHCVTDRGAVLIPAFSIGRTQELLYELEDIIYQCKQAECAKENSIWHDIVVIVDSPMAAQFTQQYRKMRDLWDAEALGRLADDRHPLNFKRMHIVDSHAEHERLVNYLKSTGEPCIVIAASGMCTGGRMVNYLRALLPDPRTDVLFVGFQAAGTPGRDIQRYGPRGGYVDLDGERIWIKAEIHTLGGYSAHADQQELIEFIAGAEHVRHVRLVHGDAAVQREFRDILQERFPNMKVDCACDL